ncbi:MAG: hypothetical protein FWE23_09045 [Chitinivibrionia bacterium]|nr:hypothetical protein [Chitinivibrionia bacterium]
MRTKSILFILAAALCAAAVAVPKLEFTLRDGEVVSGYLICQDRVNITLKSGRERISVNIRNIKYFGDENIAAGSGRRHFVLDDSLLLANKNEVAFINTSPDIARIRLRKVSDDGKETLFGEKTAQSGDTVIFFVPDGRFYEAVEFTRSEDEIYFGIGRPFEKRNRCNSFSRDEIELRGVPADGRVPQLRGDMLNFKRDGD